jgi:hypothetical protein
MRSLLLNGTKKGSTERKVTADSVWKGFACPADASIWRIFLLKFTGVKSWG